jgi:hypothetical protein
LDDGSQKEVHGMSSNQYGATTVVVRRLPGVIDAPGRAVHASGGSVVQQLNTLNGISADVPSNRPAALRADADVESGTEDAGPIPAGSRQRLGVIP